ncbi:hypothetical protein BGW39_002329, partial [Mortierella sp. 14UC]
MSTPTSASSPQRPTQAMPNSTPQLGSSTLLKPSGHQRSRSVDGGQHEEGYSSDARSISSTHSMRSKMSHLWHERPRFFSRKPKKQDPKATPGIMSASTPGAEASTNAFGNVTMAIPTSKPGSLPTVSAHRIDATIPELKITDVPVDMHRPSHPNASASGNINCSATLSEVSNTPPARNVEIFSKNIRLPSPKVSLPKKSFRFESTSQLAFCIGLLRADQLPPADSTDNDGATVTSQDKAVDTLNRQWIKATTASTFEKAFVLSLAPKLVAEFAKDPTKNSTVIKEIAIVAPVLEKEDYRTLLGIFIKEFDESRILGVELLQGLVHVVQSRSPGFLESDDLVKILASLGTCLQGTHPQSSVHSYHLTLAVSQILDVMAEHKVKDLNREALHEPLSAVLLGMKDSSDPYLMYQACYAFQALQRVPDDETDLQAFLRHSTGMVDGLIKVSGLAQLDFAGFMEGLKEIQEVVEKTAGTLKSAFEGVMALVESGRGIVDSVKGGLGGGRQRLWYRAILGATKLVRDGQLVDLRKLILGAPCRRDPLFQMGICQLLGEIADDACWGVATRKQAIDFIEELSMRDQDWGQDESVKQWTWTIVSRISKAQEQAVGDHASVLEVKLRKEGYSEFSSESPLRSRFVLPSTCILLNEVQHIPEIEKDLHRRAKVQQEFHLKEQHPVYIPPQAKASRRAEDSDHSPLMKEVKTFLAGERQVLLLLGDSGAGKTTFNHMLAYDLWRSYTFGGRVPLFINLPTVDQPDKDLITEQLKLYKFSGPQIKELEEQDRQFILICDGYDERQLNTNLYTRNCLNQPGSWKAKLIVSCRSQYLKKEYLHNFQPKSAGRSHRAAATELFQEAVIVPFTKEQVEDYVKEFVGLSNEQLGLRDRPNWTDDEYMAKLKAIPDLMELVGNPFLLTVSLQVLHQVIGNNQDLAKIRVTRVKLYDIFIDEWIERNKDRLLGSQTSLLQDEQHALDELINDHTDFTRHAINFMKRLATSIFDKQAGNPTIEYSQHSDSDSWKAQYFSDNPKISILRKVCPLEGGATQFRLLHRSLLEYFYSLVFFDPIETPEMDDNDNDDVPSFQKLRDSLKAHPLTKKPIDDEPLVVEFLAERAQTEPRFQQQLLVMMDTMETDVESVQGAKNAVAIL